MSDKIQQAIHAIYDANESPWRIFIDKSAVENWIDSLIAWLFRTSTKLNDLTVFESHAIELHGMLQSFLESEGFPKGKALSVADHFFAELPGIRSSLSQDLDAIMEFDPAAKSKNEVLLAYPGFFALSVYRVAHQLEQLEIPILPRLISEYAHSRTGIDIHPAATIGKRFFIDHGTGIVIGETAIIGNDVKIYQGVTLGALTVSKDKAREKRHPTIEDNVTLYANATILGGTTTIGRNAVIGGNVWVTSSIPPNSVVFHKSEMVIKNTQEFPEAINFNI